MSRTPSTSANFIVDKADIGSAYGAPEYIIPEVQGSLLEAVDQHALNPDEVVFTGYNGDSRTLDQRKLTSETSRGNTDIAELATQVALMHEDGSYVEDLEAIMEVSSQEILRRARSQPRLPLHFFAGAAQLDSDKLGENNPIHFAGTLPTSTIDVYDLEDLRRISEEQGYGIEGAPDSALSVRGLIKNLKPAHALRFKPKYRPDRETRRQGDTNLRVNGITPPKGIGK